MVSGFHVWFAIVVLYFLESIRFTTPSAVIFRRGYFSGGWSGFFPSLYPGNGRFGWFIRSLLPGAPSEVVLQDFVIAVGDGRIAPNTAMLASKRDAVDCGSIQRIDRNDRFLTINDSMYVFCETPQDVLFLRDALRNACTHGEKSLAARYLDQKTGTRLESLRENTVALRTLSAALWSVLLVTLPVALAITRNDLVLIPVAALAWLLAIGVAIAAGRSRRRILKSEGFPWGVLRYVFYPVSAMRAEDDLTDGLLAGVHPVTFAIEKCSAPERTRLLRDLYLRTRYPVSVSQTAANPAVEQVCESWNAIAAEALREKIASKAPEVLASLTPERQTEGCLTWCPRCLTQYRHEGSTCADCPGIELRSFSETRKAVRKK